MNRRLAVLAASVAALPAIGCGEAEAFHVTQRHTGNMVTRHLRAMMHRSVPEVGANPYVGSRYPTRVLGPHKARGGGIVCGWRACRTIRVTVEFKHRDQLLVVKRVRTEWL